MASNSLQMQAERLLRGRIQHNNIGLFVSLVLVVGLLIVDLEVSELVAVLGASHHTQPVPQVGLLSLHGELLAKVAGLAGNLDALLEVFLEISAVHDSILDWVSAVNEELDLVLLAELLHTFTLPLELLLAGLLGRGLLCCWCHYKWGLYSETRISCRSESSNISL